MSTSNYKPNIRLWISEILLGQIFSLSVKSVWSNKSLCNFTSHKLRYPGNKLGLNISSLETDTHNNKHILTNYISLEYSYITYIWIHNANTSNIWENCTAMFSEYGSHIQTVLHYGNESLFGGEHIAE